LESNKSVLINTRSLATNNLKANQSERLTIFQDSLKKMNVLCERCPVIQQSNWFQYSPNQRGGLETVLGWLIAALAVTLGAPFWFDLLSKLVSVRGCKQNDQPQMITLPKTPPQVLPQAR
jgi:hypothetical protein